jgi:hypothetical protein
MSTCTHESMTNHHALSVLAGVGELTHWSERDLHDAGLSWSDVVYEAQKPFWRA